MSELEIGRAEPRQRARQTRSGFGAGPFDQPRQPQRKLPGRRHQARIDGAEHAFAREHVTGADQPRDVGRRRNHKRQPECNATIPPERLSHFTREKPASRIISANAFGRGNFLIELDEVLIGFRIAGYGTAERRNHLEREEVVERIEAGHVDGGEFQTKETAAGPQHAIGLAQRGVDPRHVANTERDGVGVERTIAKRQRLGIAFDKGNLLIEMARRSPVAADVEHVGVDVADGGAEAQAGCAGGAEGDIAGAARDVEQRKRRIGLRRVERIDHDVFPDPVQAPRHQIVHQIVTGRDAVKHIVHQRLLVPQGHVPEAEMGGLVRPIHELTPLPQTIARRAQWRYHVTSIR